MNALLSTKEVAAQLHVSANTVKKLWREGRLRGVQLSQRKLRFYALDVEDYLRGGSHPASPPFRGEEWAWRAKNQREQARLVGNWLVVEGSELITYDPDPVRAVERARSLGILVPYLFYLDPAVGSGAQMGL